MKEKSLFVYNTMTRKKEKFEPLQEGRVGIYVCGPTVYGDAHIGHAKSYIFFDLVNRLLRHLSYNVCYVQNITDVGHLTDNADEGEDKMIKQARAVRVHPMELAETYTRRYFEDMDALNIMRPNISPRAAGHIPEQIEMIETLIRKGYAYEANGSVYFDIRKHKGYGALSGRTVDDQKEAVRIEKNSEKRFFADFALWKKAAPEHILQWPSPWGLGYPGWHIECSAMAVKYLGQPFDIHGGGLENTFPHHECEIAQSECALDKPFAKYWLHNNMVTVDGKKMGKPLGNFVTIRDLLSGDHPAVGRPVPADAIRFFVLSSHYRSSTDFSMSALAGAEKGLEKIKNCLRDLKVISSNNSHNGPKMEEEPAYLGTAREKFIEAMLDDFNTPVALSIVFELVVNLNTRISKGEMGCHEAFFAEKTILELLETILGIPVSQENCYTSQLDDGLLANMMSVLIEIRDAARNRGDWNESDLIRDKLVKLGVEIKDSKDGTKWFFNKQQATPSQ